MNLNSFISDYIKQPIHWNIENIGLADSIRPNTISFLENCKFVTKINNNPNIVAVFVRPENLSQLRENIECILVEQPKATLFSLHDEYCKQYLCYQKSQIAESAIIHPSAIVEDAGVFIESNVHIGANTIILEGTMIGENTVIGAKCVIGSNGFHVYDDLNGIKRVAIHDGKVVIGQNVNIHASVVIDKGLMGRDTYIADESKIDNMVHIAHRAQIGCRTIISSSTVVAGSVDIGQNVRIGPGSIISNRVRIGDNANIILGSVVIHNVRKNAVVSGNFAIKHDRHLLVDAKNNIN